MTITALKKCGKAGGAHKEGEEFTPCAIITEGSLFTGSNPWGKQELGKEIGAALHKL